MSAVDRQTPPGALDPKVALPARLMTPEEQARASLAWTVIGGGIVEAPASCVGSDTRSSMEEYWRRRPIIVGASSAPAQFWENLFAGRDVRTPRTDAVAIPPGFTCTPWRRDTAPVAMPPGGIIQRAEGWWRICSPPADKKPKPPPPQRARAVPLRPPTPATPRPALPTRPGRFRGPAKPPAVGKKLDRKKPAKPPTRPTDADQIMEWLEGQEALAAELATYPPDVRAAVLFENPEVVYVWILLGWLEVDDRVRQAFETLSAELAELGLSLFDFEAATRADLPPAVARELKAAPLGALAELIAPAPFNAGAPVAGAWDAQTGIFLPTDPGTAIQRPTFGYVPQAPRTNAPAPASSSSSSSSGQDRREKQPGDPDTTIAGCPCLEGHATRIAGYAPGLEALGSTDDPRCCPDCAWENLGRHARAWCAGIARPEARVGDFWSDLGRGVATADRFLSDNVWDNVKGVVPYGDVIDKAHRARMGILERAAPDFYPGRGTAKGAAPAKAAKGARSSSSSSGDARTDRAITTATRLSDGVKAGDAGAIATAKRIKDAAAAGDPEARRNWRVYVLVSRDVHGAG